MIGGQVLTGDAGGTYRGVAIDSRRVTGGELFFALAGSRTDGHVFVADALGRGAAAAVVEQGRARAEPQELGAWGELGTVIGVPRTLEALHDLTRGIRRLVPQKLVGITGSAGKTTTKEVLAHLLAIRFRVARSPGNLNNLLGFPLALLGIPADTEWMVAEMGMSEPGELAQLSRLARPDVAIFTNVGSAHLESFGSVRAIAEAKAELLAGLPADGLVIANADDPEVRRIAGRHRGRVVFFGRGAGHEVRAEDLEVAGDRPATRFELVAGSERAAVEVPLLGLHNVDNFLAAAACAWALGLGVGEIAEAARSLAPAPGRGAVTRLPNGATLVDDSYNSNPEAVERALEAVRRLSGRRHWAVLGDMLELGQEAPEFHRRAGETAARLGFDPVFGVGPEARELVAAAEDAGADGRWFRDTAAAADAACAEVRDGDVVLVKGSRGIALDVVVRRMLAAGEA